MVVSGLLRTLLGGVGIPVRVVNGLSGLPTGDTPNGKPTGPSSAKKAVSKLATLTTATAATAPLAVMFGVSEWAEDTSHDKERTHGLMGVSNWLKDIFGDPTKGSRARYEERRAELSGEPMVIENNIHIDGEQVAKAVNKINSLDSKRQ